MKQEMLTMMHYDALYSPTPQQLGITPGSKKPPSQKGVVNQAQHLAYLEQNPYAQFEDEELQQVRVCSSLTVPFCRAACDLRVWPQTGALCGCVCSQVKQERWVVVCAVRLNRSTVWLCVQSG